MAQYAFGFLQRPLQLSSSSLEIFPIAGIDRIIRDVVGDPTAGKRWYYPPTSMSPTEGISLPSPRYELPTTHVLTTKNRTHEADYGEFLVLILGFTLGLRLTPEGTGHLWPTAIQEGQLVSFRPKTVEILFCLERATAFWDDYPEVRRLMFGAVHWFLVSQSYRSQYEQFAWMYTVLDTLHRIASKTSDLYRRRPSVGHGGRPIALSETFGSPLPETFVVQSNKTTALVEARNNLVHEARWAEEPLGHAASESGQRMIYEMGHFCSQIILALMNVPCEFRTVEYSRSVHGLDVDF